MVTYILLVEDNPIDARLMSVMFRQLTDWPTSITWLDDGEKALRYLGSLEAGGIPHPPGFVLLDVNLPKFDGLEVLAAFRKSDVGFNLPIFLYSSASVESISALAEERQLHADGCFEKAFGLKNLQDLVGTIRARYEQASVKAAVVGGQAGVAIRRSPGEELPGHYAS
jgi:CheY-like chemotaxis protein